MINNAVDAFDGHAGSICLKLNVDREWVRLGVSDNGKGMPPELIDKITNRIAVTAGKKSGHGIGFTQIWDTIDKNQGELLIDSQSGKGTTITIHFPRVSPPQWIAEEILLKRGDIVIILDDDASIHNAWNARFESVIVSEDNIKFEHFRDGKKALDFIQKLPDVEKNKIFLLTDYELLKQELNGLHLISIGKVHRSILVTSYFADPLIQERSTKMNAKILPKHLASEIAIKVDKDLLEIREQDAEMIEFVLVDDNKQFVNILMLSIFRDLEIDSYSNPENFLINVEKYSKQTVFFLDNNYADSNLKGLDVAIQLFDLGYKHLYILSGEEFSPGEIPHFVTIIQKNNVDFIRQIVDKFKKS